MSFGALWRGQRCARQLRAYLDTATVFNPKLVSTEQLRQALSHSLDAFAINVPGSDKASPSHDELDLLFSSAQDRAVSDFASTLFPQARDIEGDTLWQLEGETLREIGWIRATHPENVKTPQINADNWHKVLSKLPALKGPSLINQVIFVKAEYLFRTGLNSWLLLFVRPSTRVKDTYIAEAELTRAAFLKAGVQVDQCWILHPNEHYQRPAGDANTDAMVDPLSFFRIESLNQAIKHMRNPISGSMTQLLTGAIANKVCDAPRSCPICSRELPPLPEHSIYTLHRGGRAVELLEAEGILDLAFIEQASAGARAELKDRHRIQLSAIRSDRPHIDRKAVRDFVQSLRFPLSFLDFESTSEAIPPLASSKPWEHLPFMFSVHRVEKPEDLDDVSKLPAKTWVMDPMRPRDEQSPAMVEALLFAIGGGNVLAYGSSLELATIQRLAKRCPDRAEELQDVADRIVDLQFPFQQFWFYHPRQHGKLGLKKVLPLLSDRDHADLELSSGGQANLLYWFLSHTEVLDEENPHYNYFKTKGEKILATIVEYCTLDTLGLVYILLRLRALAA